MSENVFGQTENRNLFYKTPLAQNKKLQDSKPMSLFLSIFLVINLVCVWQFYFLFILGNHDENICLMSWFGGPPKYALYCTYTDRWNNVKVKLNKDKTKWDDFVYI